MGRVIGLLVVMVIVGMAYKLYFSHLQSAGTGAPGEAAQSNGARGPAQIVNEVGAKNDLINISRAEQGYHAQHNYYGSYDQLVSDGALTMSKPGRDGYSYEVENSAEEFRAMARCSPAISGCTSWVIDQTLRLRPAP
jgi:hypothetical protein